MTTIVPPEAPKIPTFWLGRFTVSRRDRFGLLDVGRVTDWPDVTLLSHRLGVYRENFYRWRRTGVDDRQADAFACRLNVHPSHIWPAW